MKIVLGQLWINYEDKESSFVSAKSLAENAAKNGHDIIVFPEMTLTGFSMDTAKTKESGRETVKRFSELAAENNIAIGFGWVEDAGERARNMYTVVDKTGGVIAEYAKIHPFSYAGEDKYFEGGESLCRFEFMGIKIGAAICYDLRFPQIFGGDYDIMLVPANWPRSRSEHWLTLLKARAVENQSYFAGINCAGEEYGNTCIFDPNGDSIGTLDSDPGIVSADISRESVAEIRKVFPVRNDRRHDIYGKF